MILVSYFYIPKVAMFTLAYTLYSPLPSTYSECSEAVAILAPAIATHIPVLYDSKIYLSIYPIFYTCLHIPQLSLGSRYARGIAPSTHIPALAIFPDYIILVLYFYILKVTTYTLVYTLDSPLDSIYSQFIQAAAILAPATATHIPLLCDSKIYPGTSPIFYT